MSKTIFRYVLMFIILVVSQAIVFNHICLFDVAVPLVFIYLIIKLPITLGQNQVMTIGFILGLVVDIFSDTQGMNALCCTIASACRHTIFRLYCPREDEMNGPEPSSANIGAFTFMKYNLTFTLFYCILYFLVESLIIFNPAILLAKILGSAGLTFAIIEAIDFITHSKREKRS